MGLVHLLWSLACCGPGTKHPVSFRASRHPSPHACLSEGRAVWCCRNNSGHPAATGLLIPLVLPRADAGSRGQGWDLHPLRHTGMRENTASLAFLILGAVPVSGFIVIGLLQQGGQPAVARCHRLFLRAWAKPTIFFRLRLLFDSLLGCCCKVCPACCPLLVFFSLWGHS